MLRGNNREKIFVDEEDKARMTCPLDIKKVASVKGPVPLTFWKLTEEEFEIKSKTILEMIGQGESDFSLYPKLFHIFERLVQSKSIPMDLEDLETLFKKGAEHHKTNRSTPVKFDHNFEMFEKNVSVHYKQIRNHCYEINEALSAKAVANDIIGLERLIDDDPKEFCVSIGNKNGKYNQLLLFKYLNIKKLIISIENADNETIIDFRNALENRYGFTNISELYSEELEGLTKFEVELSSLVSKYSENKGYCLKCYVVRALHETVASVVNRLRKKS